MRMAKMKETDKGCHGYERNGTLKNCWWSCRSVKLHWKTIWKFLHRLNIEKSSDSAISVPGKNHKVEKNDVTKISAQISLFLMAKTAETINCPPTMNE